MSIWQETLMLSNLLHSLNFLRFGRKVFPLCNASAKIYKLLASPHDLRAIVD